MPPASKLAERAWESIDAIADDILEQRYNQGESSLHGHAVYEDAILLAYMASKGNECKWKNACVDRVNHSIENSVSTISRVGLYGGISGLGWTVEHLATLLCGAALDTGGLGSNTSDTIASGNDPCEDLDEGLVRLLRFGLPMADYDLLEGYVGLGVYFLERWPRGRSIDGICLVIDGLERLSEENDTGIAWYSQPEQMKHNKACPAGCYNLGVAHGVPGVLHFLCQASRRGVEAARASNLLGRAKEWLLAQASSQKRQAKFGAWVTRDGAVWHSRPVWCYGDLGVAAVLSQIAAQTEDIKLDALACDMIDRCIALSPDKYQIRDAGLCHGATGVAHIYNRLYHTKGNPRYRDASVSWFEYGLNMFQRGTGIGGYCKCKTSYDSTAQEWEASPAFLDGSIGVALALLGAVTAVEPQWDRLLLLSSCG